MKIGELAKRTDVSRDTIRFYEKKGLLKEIERPHQYNNYKEYGDENVERIQMIKKIQKSGFTLRECKEILEKMDEGAFHCEIGKKMIHDKIKEVDRKIEELKKIRVELMRVLEY